jgi:hypothetical protein
LSLQATKASRTRNAPKSVLGCKGRMIGLNMRKSSSLTANAGQYAIGNTELPCCLSGFHEPA